MKNLFLIFTLCLFSLSVLCGCGAQKTSQNALSHAKLMNKLTVGVKNDSKPFGFVDNEGNPAGFDVDVAKEIARQILGDENAVEFVYVTPSSRITDLNSRKVDMVIAAMSITPNRADVVSFSQPYYQSGQAIMVKEGSKISSLADLNGSNVGFVLGTTGEKTIRNLAPAASLRAAKTYPEIFNLLKNGEIEAILADDTMLYGLASDNKGYKILPKRYTREYYAVAMRSSKESEELREAVDVAVNYMQQRGILNKIKNKWLPPLHY